MVRSRATEWTRTVAHLLADPGAPPMEEHRQPLTQAGEAARLHARREPVPDARRHAVERAAPAAQHVALATAGQDERGAVDREARGQRGPRAEAAPGTVRRRRGHGRAVRRPSPGHDVLGRLRIALGRAAPEAAAEGRHVDARRVRPVGHHAVAPLEVEAAEAAPRLAAILRSPGGLVEPAGVENGRVARVQGHVVHVLGFGQDVAPRFAGVRAQEDPAARVSARSGHPPRREIEPSRVQRVRREGVRTVRPRGQGHSRPAFPAVGGAVERAVTGVADTPALAAASHHEVQRPLGGTADPPGKGLRSLDARVLERPRG